MILRFYDRANPASGLHFFACYDGTNADEILAVLRSGGSNWNRIPTQFQVLRFLLDDYAPGQPVDIMMGDWVSASGKKTDADLRADFYLADDEFHL